MRTFVASLLLVACGASPAPPAPARPTPAPSAMPAPAAASKVISIIGTNDLHGHLEHLDVFAGYVARLREERRADGGVILLDAGDMFQGTLESNPNEGAAVIEAMNLLRYTAAAIGNHDFDYGPIGEAEQGDPRGALRARIAEARFPMLSANLIDTRTSERPAWKNLESSTLVEISGVKVGLVGVLTLETPNIVMPAFFAGLGVTPLAPAVTREAALLRGRGARAVVAVAHAGGACTRFDDPRDASSCKPDEELARLARDLPPGSVDAIVAGHTHHGVAHFLSGVAVAESYSYGRAFSRIDLTVPPDDRSAVAARVFAPREICSESARPACVAGRYEGGEIRPDAAMRASMKKWLEAAAERRAERLGVRVTRELRRDYSLESPLGNWLSDVLLAATPGADLAIMNGGGLRASLPAGELTYGQLYESQPFDNRVARLELTGDELEQMLVRHLERPRHGILSIGGGRVSARCASGKLVVDVFRPNGRRVRRTEKLVIVTSDYLASGGDELFVSAERPAPVVRTEDRTVRDALAGELRRRGGQVDGDSPALFDPARPRLRLPTPRPIRCPE